jgi:tetratricopeptide (TPR) repeat protein
MGSRRAATVVAGLMTLVAGAVPSAAAGHLVQLAQATSQPEIELEVDTTPESDRLRRQAQEHLDRGAEQRRLGDLDAASADFAAAQGIFNRLGDPAGEASALLALGQIDLERQEYDFATTSLDRARHLFRQLGDHLGEADSLVGLGEVERETGDPDLAARDFAMAAALYNAAGDTERAAWAFDQAAAMVSAE